MPEILGGHGFPKGPEVGRASGSRSARDTGLPVDSRPIGVERLLRRPVPDIPRAQLEWYTPKNLQLRPVRSFSPQGVLESVRQAEGQDVLAFDIGGDKIAAGFFKVVDGFLQKEYEGEKVQKGEGGVGYLALMEDVAQRTDGGRGLVIGISFAGPIDDARPIVGTNVRTFQRELVERYGGDMANMFPNAVRVVGGNDAETGIAAGVVAAVRQNPNLKKVIYVIHGGGNGGAVSKNDTIIAGEPGHVPVIKELNPYGRTVPCGQEGSPTPDRTCVEKIGASGQGVEQTYFEQTGKKLTGVEINNLYQQGDLLASSIYDAAVRVAATGIVGLDQATEEPGSTDRALDPDTTMVVAHGGLFKPPGLGERMEDILEAHVGYKPVVLYTSDFSENACIDGAAILALIA